MEILLAILSTGILYLWVNFIGKKALSLNKTDPERKSNKWLLGELSNMGLIFILWVGPVIVFNVDLISYYILFFIGFGFNFYIFYKYYAPELRATIEQQKKK